MATKKKAALSTNIATPIPKDRDSPQVVLRVYFAGEVK
jgi:hypothetical protein